MVKSMIDLTLICFEIFHNVCLMAATRKSVVLPSLLRFPSYKLTVDLVFLISKLLSTLFYFF